MHYQLNIQHQTRYDFHTAPIFSALPDSGTVCKLGQEDRQEVVRFLAMRPVHTVVMTSFINDNGMESPLNRGRFFGYRNGTGTLEGVALIGHSTLIDARSDAALAAFADTARTQETPIHMVMSDGDKAEQFWNLYSFGLRKPREVFKELLFEIGFPFPVQQCEWEIRNATGEELADVAQAQADVAMLETGIDPFSNDPKGFLQRVGRRIEQGRCFVAYDEDGHLVFKADIVAETADVAYLEGVYVSPKYRGRGIGTRCLSRLCMDLLGRYANICLLSNSEFEGAHRSFANAGMRHTDSCTTVFA